ncbi:hypothetical protein [Listeria booriae]|nr:hypothetical protein [Listeria booriae]
MVKEFGRAKAEGIKAMGKLKDDMMEASIITGDGLMRGMIVMI